ncbi:MAG TPA: hypothetical protein VF381_06210 [Thermoanaerobaculia bacterium]
MILDKRAVVNKWFGSMGYDISAMAKPWSFGPFGRDTQVVGEATRSRKPTSTSRRGAT